MKSATENQLSRPKIRLPRTAAGSFVALFSLWWVLLVVFHAFPQIDIAASRYFFVVDTCKSSNAAAQICGHFPSRQTAFLDILRTIFFRLPYVVAVGMLIMLIACYGHHGATFNALRARNLKIALTSLLLGPGLIVNLILKEHSGRPRPISTLDFGGTLDFIQAGSFAGKCLSNCSFVSGEAASAGWLLCLLVLIPQPARTGLFLPILAISILTPLMRLAFGAHFLSDVVLGWLLAVVVFAGVFALADSSHRAKNSEI
ncbi:phosphatase PAP2 family protein [Rhizobium sp. P32RR-XVIII]|uniref:phosphatase PAP2 family protein n=1 Tax=Rhizobium sp. P32RR-XVIII TaxID=2726738 RepID=UPI0014575FAA|nr:phosphatase PAP2 family protein [Rhizobium sp. P32RR-XVIII]NLS03062.1 phosphatase PAP2 family protein [Rhizobium sp. P32RR-XVIII]